LAVGGPRQAEKKANEIFVTMGSTPNIICVGTMSGDVSPHLGGGRIKNSKN